MNLKTIKKQPFNVFSEKSQVCWKVEVREPVVDGERLLAVDFLNNRQCTHEYRKNPSFRIICGKKSKEVAGIDQDGKEQNAIVQNLQRYRTDYVLISDREEKRLLRFLGIDRKKSINHGIDNLADWVKQTKEEMLRKKKVERGELLDEDYRLCPEEIPEGLFDYIRNVVLAADHVLIYKKGNVRGFCYDCKEEVLARQYSERFTQYAKVRCPNCGGLVQCILDTSSAFLAENVENVVMAQRGTDGETIFFRQWRLLRDPSGQWGNMNKWLKETVRYAVRGKQCVKWQKEEKHTFFYHSERYDLQEWDRWKGTEIYDNGYYFCPHGIEEVLRGTRMEYANILEHLNENPVKYLMNFARYPVMEFFEKAGYSLLMKEKNGRLSKATRNAIRWQKGNLKECFRFPLHWLKLKEPEKYSMEDIHRMNVFYAIRPQAAPKEVEQVLNTHIDVDDMKILLRYMNMDKLENYLDKQKEKEEKEGAKNYGWLTYRVSRTYRDYIQECQMLGLNLKDKQVLFPKDLKQAHDRTMAQVKFEKDKADQEKFRKAVIKMEKYAWQWKGLLIRPARTQEELRDEGGALHHCVAGYCKRIADQETAVFLIRKAEEPDKPYFTLELKDRTVIQCRTDHNRSYGTEPEVFNFVDQWMKRVVNKGGKKKEDNAA